MGPRSRRTTLVLFASGLGFLCSVVKRMASTKSQAGSTLEVVKRMYESKGNKMVIATTGSGGYGLASLCQVPGMSNLIQEINVPYATASSTEYLGKEPKKFVSADTAQNLALSSFRRARWLERSSSFKDLTSTKFIGVGCTASVVSTKPKRGLHQAYVATCDGETIRTRHLVLEKAARDRIGEDKCIGALLIQMAAESLGTQVPEGYLDGILASTAGGKSKDTLSELKDVKCESSIEAILSGHASRILFYGENNKGLCDVDLPPRTLIFPGSYNPLHEGHLGLAAAAQKTAARLIAAESKEKVEDISAFLPRVVFEISIANADKGVVDVKNIQSRIAQFKSAEGGPWPLLITNASLFKDKTDIIPGCWFVIGADTAIRIVNPKYYGNSKWTMYLSLRKLLDSGVKFFVGVRATKNGDVENVKTITDFLKSLDEAILEGLSDLFVGIPEKDFRLDLSSTEIRERMK